MEILLKTNTKIEFETFIPKESNLIKVSLHSNGNDIEGIWACISDKDKADYDNNVSDSEPTRVATLRNSAVMFYPNNSWGLCVPIKFKGTERPECDVTWIHESSRACIIETETI